MSKLEQLIAELCPEGVEYKTLGQLGTFYSGLTGKSKEDFRDGNAKFITYMNVFNNLEIDRNISEKVHIEAAERQNIVRFGDVLFTGSSETPDECGMSSVLAAEPNESLYLNSFCFGFRFDNEALFLPAFSKYVFRSDTLRKQISKTASGVTRFNVSKEKMRKITIPIPPLPVQHEIIRMLDNFTKLTAELTAELTAREKQYEYYRNELLTFGDDVPMVPLDTIICSLKTGLNPRKNFILNDDNAKNFYVTVREIVNGKIVFFDKTDRVNDAALLLIKKRSSLDVGDVLFSGTGTIGRTAVVEETPTNWGIKEGVYAIKPDQTSIMSKYLAHVLCAGQTIERYKRKIVGSPVASLPMADLKKLSIPLPPLTEQARIVAILDRFDALTNDITSGLPAEIDARNKQYEYYRDKLLTFKEADA